jgi:hypothetical protein
MIQLAIRPRISLPHPALYPAPDRYVESFLSEFYPDYWLRANDDWCMVGSTRDQQYAHLRQFDRLPHDVDDEVLVMCDEELELFFKDLPQIPLPKFISLDGLNWSASPGYQWIQKGNWRTKSEAWIGGAGQCYKERLSELLNNNTELIPFPHLAGGRGKLVNREKARRKLNKGEAVGRLIQMSDVVDVALCSHWSYPLHKLFSSADFGIAMGKSWTHEGAEHYIDMFNYTHERRWSLGLDFRKYDGNVPTFLVKRIFKRLRSMFIDGRSPRYDAYWQYMEDMHMRANIIMSDGFEFQLPHGLSTGCPFVSLIQSIATLMILRVSTRILLEKSQYGISHDCFQKIDYRDQSLGDDSWLSMIYTDELRDLLSVEQYSTIILDAFGVTVSVDKTYSGTTYKDMYFLGKHVKLHRMRCIPWRPIEETYRRWYWPEHDIKTPQHSFDRTYGLMFDNAFCPDLRILVEYLSWLRATHDIEGYGGLVPKHSSIGWALKVAGVDLSEIDSVKEMRSVYLKTSNRNSACFKPYNSQPRSLFVT